MSNPKYKRKTVANLLSRAVSFEEIIIDTVSEMTRKSHEEVAEKFKKSTCSTKLYDFDSEYYLNDINLIIGDFLNECEEKYNWTTY